MTEQWVELGNCDTVPGTGTVAAVNAALQCRRVVQVRFRPDGLMVGQAETAA